MPVLFSISAAQPDITEGRWSRMPPWCRGGRRLVPAFWPIAWFGSTPERRRTSFSLWLGHVRAVNGLMHALSGILPLRRSYARRALLVAFSISLWRLFEGGDHLLDDRHYVIFDTLLAHIQRASLAFSTVILAVCKTATLQQTSALFHKERRWQSIAPGLCGGMALPLFRPILVAVSLRWPRVFFLLEWIGELLLIDSIGRAPRLKSAAEDVTRGQQDAMLLLWAIGPIGGFFRESWNVRPTPKRIPAIPCTASPAIFEMPESGYGGYLPFALETSAASHPLHGLPFRRPRAFLPFATVRRLALPS